MVPQQKEAVVVLASSLAFAVALFLARTFFDSMQSEIVFVTLVALIASVWIGRRLVGLRTKTLDERDLSIRYQAGLVASHGFGMVVMVGALLLWVLHRTSLPSVYVALLAYWGWTAMYLVWSATVLVLYRRGG